MNPDSKDDGAALRLQCCPPKNIIDAVKCEFKVQNLWMTGELSFGKVNWLKGFGSSSLRPLSDNPIGVKLFMVWRVLLACLGFAIWVWSLSTDSYPDTWIYCTL